MERPRRQPRPLRYCGLLLVLGLIGRAVAHPRLRGGRQRTTLDDGDLGSGLAPSGPSTGYWPLTGASWPGLYFGGIAITSLLACREQGSITRAAVGTTAFMRRRQPLRPPPAHHGAAARWRTHLAVRTPTVAGAFPERCFTTPQRLHGFSARGSGGRIDTRLRNAVSNVWRKRSASLIRRRSSAAAAPQPPPRRRCGAGSQPPPDQEPHRHGS